MKSTLLFAIVASAGCAVAAPRAERSVAPQRDGDWHYDVAVSEDLARMDVRLTFAGDVPQRLDLGIDEGTPYLSHVVLENGSASRALAREGNAFVTGNAQDGATITYRVDFARLVEEQRGQRAGRDRSASPGLWLLRPYRLPETPRATLTLHVPEGNAASVPWRRIGPGETFALDASAFRWRGFAAFGPMERREMAVAGATFDVAILDFPHAVTWPGVERWLARGASATADLYREFPVPRVQIVLRPTASNEAVSFGETQRGGGPAVLFRIGSEARDADFDDDWVATHEFAHLGMPAIADADAWLSEGFIQYYTEVLRGRAGILDERGAWQQIVAGFSRGRAQGVNGSLAETSASMQRAHAYMCVYWGGAAIALLLDVELRRSSGGQLSLDDAMREVRRVFNVPARHATAAEILRHLDAWLGRPLFSETAARHLAASEFPDVAPVLAELGVVVRGDRVSFDDAAPLAAMRRAIMTPGR